MLEQKILVGYFITHKDGVSKYLEKFNIAKDEFNFSIASHDIYSLERYCDEAYSKASKLVVEDECVGRTFDNIDLINEEINRAKTKSKSLAV